MADPAAIVDNLFRDKYREILAALTREYGPARLDIIEDAIQEAMLKSLEIWSVGPVPDNPGGWLFVTARRRVIDKLRGTRRSEPTEQLADSKDPNTATLNPLEDDVLKMIFICCHPELNWKSQLALMLKNLCALGNAEIAAALLTTPGAVKKTLTRAKTRIRQLRLRFELPDDASIQHRLDAVLRCIYMMFNEGYLGHGGDQLTERALCEQAVALTKMLANAKDLTDPGKVCAVVALLSLQASRLSTRTDGDGRIVRLADQDRAQWDRALVRQGMGYLELSMQSQRRSVYHLQAAIAACHATAPTYGDTDWRSIRTYYDQLRGLDASPVIALNRTAAIAMTDGYAAALTALQTLEDQPELARYYLLPALKADYQRELGDTAAAMANYRLALQLATDATSRTFLKDRLAECAFDY